MAASSAVGHASRVGQHYSQVKQVGLDKRDEARIIKMRNFNNFIKSLLINMYTNQGKSAPPHPVLGPTGFSAWIPDSDI